MHGHDTAAIEEVELDHVESPFVKDGVEDFFQIFAHLRVIDVERIEAAPIQSRKDGFALGVPRQPVGMLLDQPAVLLRAERSQPKPRLAPHLVQPVRYRTHAPGKFAFEGEPIAHGGLITVVYLEDVGRYLVLLERGYVAVYQLLGNARIIVVPRRIAESMLDARRGDLHIREPLVENFAARAHIFAHVEKLVFARDRHPFNVFDES